VQSTNGQALASNYTWSFTTTGVPVAPVISSVTPGNLSTNISVNAVVSAVFSEAMNSSTLTSSTFTLNNGATGTVSYNGTTATFIPSVSLAYSTTYTATISTGVQSASGLALGSPYSWSFTTAPSTPANHMGINIDAPADYSENRTFADAIKSSRAFIKGSSLSSTVDASVDSLGWPQEDFCFYVWAGIGNMYGLHTLTFNGQATVVSNLGAVTISYDAPSNTSTGTINISVAQDGNKMLSLTFSNTKRTSTSAVGSGVTNIQLMRPTSLGAATSYPSTTLFNTPLLNEIAMFSTIRFMDWLATNTSQQVNWSDRPIPAWAHYNQCAGGTDVLPGNVACPMYGWQGIGAPIEYAVMLANQTNKDMWINIPVSANDAYITNEANLIRYGSDGVNPYTSVQTNPVYPPLNSNLNVYIEYSNETWNGGFEQMHTNCQLASNELVAGQNTDGDATTIDYDGEWEKGVSTTGALAGGMLTFSSAQILPTGQVITGTGIPGGTTITTGSSTSTTTYPVSYSGTIASESIYVPRAQFGSSMWDYTFCWRRPVERVVQISNIFRSVFGDAAMITRVRPVLESQENNGQGELFAMAAFLLGYYDNIAPGATPIATPHAPNYYIYGGGGGGYYNPTDPSPAGVNNDATGLTTFFAELQPTYVPSGGSSFQAEVQNDIAITSTLGIKRTVYEGGPSLDNFGGATPSGQYAVFDDLAAAAIADSRMTSTIEAAQNIYVANGGDLLNYYTAAGNDYQWAFTTSVYNLTSPKLNAITALNAVSAVPITYGTTVPGSISALSTTMCSQEWGCQPLQPWNSFSQTNGGGAINWASYVFNSTSTTTKTWTITLTFTSASGTISVYMDGVHQTDQTVTGSPITVVVPGITYGLHSIILTAKSGTFVPNILSVSQN